MAILLINSWARRGEIRQALKIGDENMLKHLSFGFFFVLVLLLASISADAQTKTITGYLCNENYGSSGEGTHCIITSKGKVCYGVLPETKRVNFGSNRNKPAYNNGAQYRVTIRNGTATRIVFTGRVNKSTRDCEIDYDY